MTITERDLDELFEAARAELDRRIESWPGTAVGVPHGGALRRAPRRRILVAAVALVAVGIAGLTVATRSGDELAAPATHPHQTIVGGGVEGAAQVPADVIDWHRATDLGSLARSQVSMVAAGARGFVATGVGFDDQMNQGRVWFSADGLVWEEPAPELFASKVVFWAAATAEGFYALARSNDDRLGLPEGAPQRVDTRLYRSVDGRTWEEWGAPWGANGAFASANGVLLRQRYSTDQDHRDGGGPGALEWSADGLAWHAAEFPDGAVAGVYFDLHDNLVSADDGAAYLGGTRVRQPVRDIWWSADGVTWHEIADPPENGPLVAVPNGLLLASNPGADACLGAADPPLAPAPRAAEQSRARSCARTPDVHRFVRGADTWEAAPGVPVETLVHPPLVVVGATVIAVVSGPDDDLAVWTAASESLDWQLQTGVGLEHLGGIASAQPALVASNGERAVVIVNGRSGGDGAAVLVAALRHG